MQPPDVINLNQEWFIGKQLGAGGFAKVFSAQSEVGEPTVVKLIPKTPGAQRELLPENILRLDDRWCLADFGIARYAEATTVPDTMEYSKSPPYVRHNNGGKKRPVARLMCMLSA